jgi:hypothetical protein
MAFYSRWPFVSAVTDECILNQLDFPFQGQVLNKSKMNIANLVKGLNRQLFAIVFCIWYLVFGYLT